MQTRNYPFVYKYDSDKHYDLSYRDPRNQPTLWTDKSAPPFFQKAHPNSDLLKTGAIAATVFASGFVSIGKDIKLWDKYVPAIRAIEEYSPGTILRTFQLSSFFSQFESVGTKGMSITPSVLANNPQYSEYLRRLIGKNVGDKSTAGRLAREGVVLKGGKLLWGNGDVALKYAGAIRGPEGIPSRLSESMSRHLGMDIKKPAQFFSKAAPFGLPNRVRNPLIENMPATVIGGKNIFQYGYRQSAMWGGEFVSRFNRLLEAPFEMEPFRSVFGGAEKYIKKIPGLKHGLAVKPGSALQLMTRLGTKYGLGLGALYMGWETVDYITRTSTSLDKTIFAEGLTYGIATAGVKANLMLSQAANALGLHSYREKQEEIAPNSTSLFRLAAFPLMGGLTAGIRSYSIKTARMIKAQLGPDKLTATAAREQVLESMKSFDDSGIFSKFGKYLTSPKGAFQEQKGLGKFLRTISNVKQGELAFKFFGKVGPTKFSAIIRAAIGAVLVAPFIPGALIPSTRPEELEKIYSGEKEVAIRKGRYWEFGKCLIKSNTYELYNGEIKTSDKINIGDILIGRNNRPAKVINIFKRHHTGKIRKLYSSIDRDIYTGVTNNHIIPIFRNNRIQEVDASDIKINDLVEVPYEKLDNNTCESISPSIFIGNQLFARITKIEEEEYDDIVYDFEVDDPDHLLKAGTFLVHNSPYEGQRIMYYRPHWYPRMRQRSREKGIFGPDEAKMSPLEKWYKKEFTYELEKEHYKDRPYPMCLHPDTPVLLKEHGYVPIKNIQIGDKVLNKNHTWVKVQNIANRQCTEKELIKITIAGDNRSIKTTPDHKILCLKNKNTYEKRGNRNRNKLKAIKNGSLEWLKASNIERHDFVVVPINKNKSFYNPILDLGRCLKRVCSNKFIITDKRANQKMLNAFLSNLPIKDAYKIHDVEYKKLHQLVSRGGYKKKFNRYLEITEDLAYLFGLFLAEGHTSGKSLTNFSLHKNETKTYATDILRISQKIFKTEELKCNVSFCYNQDSNGMEVKVYSSILKEIIVYLFGKLDATQKTIPNEIFNWPDNLKAALLKGLIRGDGSTSKQQEVTLTSASSSLMATARLLLLSIGIVSSFRKAIPSTSWKKAVIKNRIIPKNISYSLSITGKSLEVFSPIEEEVHCKTTTGDRKGLIYKNYLYIPVRYVEKESYEDAVYDITVDSTESFLTTCVVHNSSIPLEDVPLIGPTLAHTVGKLIKPPVLMHTEEWQSNGMIKTEQPGFGAKVATDIGELPEGAPISPYGYKGLVGEQAYRMTEMIGLPGFMMTSIKESLTGTPDLFDQVRMLESSRRMHGIEREYWDLEIGGGLGTCFVPGTKVTTQTGVKNIEDIKIGENILTHGKWKPVIDIIKKSPKENLFHIKSNQSGIDFTCTGNHWIPVLRRHRYKNNRVKPWKKENYDIIEIQACSISKNDYLFYEINPNQNNYTIDLKDNKYIDVTKELAYFIGWYIAKGCSDGTKLSFVMDTKETKHAKKLKSIAKRIGFNSSILIDKDMIKLNVHSLQLAKYFSIFEKAEHCKCIPQEFKNLPNSILSSLIEGFMLGNKSENGSISISKQLAKDLFECNLKLGIPSYLISKYSKYGIKLKSNNSNHRFIDHAFLVPVSSVLKTKETVDIVYDLTIEDLHHYTAEGVRVHNTEGMRRLYPHRRRQIPLYNPIRNTMPEWLPGPGEKGPDLLHGDPFVSIQEGELRLPGAGYLARFPELKGLQPDQYPLIHKYRILGDVAPYTNKFKSTRRAIQGARKLKSWSDYEENIFQTTEEQIKLKKIKKEFQEYKYLSPIGKLIDESKAYNNAAEDSSGLLATLNKMKAQQKEGESDTAFNRMFGSYWEMLSHNAETAFDQLTPLSPGAKLVHQRTAVESYEREQLYGTSNAFWNRPIRDFIKPFANTVASTIGFKGIPDEVQHKRNLEEYFDVLKYVKFSRLANIARINKDTLAVEEFEAKKNQTLFGINPFTNNYTSIFRSLPKRDRDYFNAFAAADTTEERARILEMVPDNEKALYIARWKQKFTQDVKKAEKMGLLSDEQIASAKEETDKIYEEVKSEGMPNNKELWAEYISTRLPQENYGDWYRRTKLLKDALLPSSDWVGWHGSVDLEDIKLKLVQNIGEDAHDYNLWASRAQRLQNKPFINQEAINTLMDQEQLTEQQRQGRIDTLFMAHKMRPHTYSTSSYTGRGSVNIKIEQESQLEDVMKEIG